ncbi:hypothetical protein ABZ897_60260 [Nonomuraea sp. NPDC046802]|uniref:hypothetical protein n=1 Tax=Nonomuraea sp. NPDC046802 TaxID=3154919 RepID=UPI003405D295
MVKVVRHSPAASIENTGKVINKAGDRGIVWNIQVLDGDDDVTFDFACFQDGEDAQCVECGTTEGIVQQRNHQTDKLVWLCTFCHHKAACGG